MPPVSQPESAGLQLSPIQVGFVEGGAPQRILGDDGLEAVSGPHIVRPPSYASNNRRSGRHATAGNAIAGSRRSELPTIAQSSRTTLPATSGSAAGGDSNELAGASTSTSEVEEEKGLLRERKKHFGLTWKQWLLVVAPGVLILVIAGIVAGVVVSRQNATGASNTSTPPTPPTPPANASAPATDPSKSSAFNGTDIALARPGLNNETLWMFYQDFEGGLSFVALDAQGLWHHKGNIPTVNGLANGSAITAINFPLANPTHINLLYVDSTGKIRNKIYNSTSQTFDDGNIYKKIFTMPPNITSIRRMSWYADNDDLFYMYAGGTDGLLHEYTHTAGTEDWQPTSDFAASNGFSGATVRPDTDLSTIHLVNADGNLELWTRTPSKENGVPEPWAKGAISTQLPVTVYTNSTLQIDKGNRQILFQDTTGEIQAIGFRGDGAAAQWNAPQPTGIKARLGTSVKSIKGGLYPGLSFDTHVFLQLNGSDITHFVRANNSGALTALETPVS